jgi:hypothetical protein
VVGWCSSIAVVFLVCTSSNQFWADTTTPGWGGAPPVRQTIPLRSIVCLTGGLGYVAFYRQRFTLPASIQPGGVLNLSPVAGQTGSTSVTIRATDSVGNTVEDSFDLTVSPGDTFTTWASRNSFPNGQSGISQNPDADAWNNLQEYAFLGNPGVSSLAAQTVFQGTTGTAPKYLTLTFPVRKFTQGLSYAVEANNSLSGAWTGIWKSADTFIHPQVVNAEEQADRTVLTIKDTTAIGATPKRFLRTRVVQE